MKPKLILLLLVLHLPGCMGLAEMIESPIRAPIAFLTIPQRQAEYARENHPTHVAGIVVDEDGNELPGATILFSCNRYVATARGSNSESVDDIQVVPTRFSIHTPAPLHHIEVSREGYYDRKYWLDAEGWLCLTEEDDYDVPGQPKTPVRSARIVLRKKGPLANIVPRLDSISVNGRGAGLVISPALSANDWNSARWIENVEQAPPGFVYVTTSRENGRIPVVIARNRNDYVSRKPALIKIGITGKDNGLILYHHQSEDEAWYETRTPPTSGYQSEIRLDDTARKSLDNFERVWLYIKCNNRLGRIAFTDDENCHMRGDEGSSYGLRLTIEMLPLDTPKAE